MKVSIDGGLTFVDSDSVHVIYDDLLCGDEHPASLSINCTTEGLIMDVDDQTVHANAATSSEMAQEIVDRLQEN